MENAAKNQNIADYLCVQTKILVPGVVNFRIQ